MQIEFQNKTYKFGDTDWSNYFTELRQMVASDMYQPYRQDKPIHHSKVTDVDIEDFMNKYFIREVTTDDVVQLCLDELKRKANVFLPIKAIDEDAYYFALERLAETFCELHIHLGIPKGYYESYNYFLDKYTFIRLENNKTHEYVYFLCDFSKATFDVNMYLFSQNDELEFSPTDFGNWGENGNDFGDKIKEKFYDEMGFNKV